MCEIEKTTIYESYISAQRFSNYEYFFQHNSDIVENICNFYTIKNTSPFAEDYGGGTPAVSLSQSSSEIRGKVA